MDPNSTCGLQPGEKTPMPNNTFFLAYQEMMECSQSLKNKSMHRAKTEDGSAVGRR